MDVHVNLAAGIGIDHRQQVPSMHQAGFVAPSNGLKVGLLLQGDDWWGLGCVPFPLVMSGVLITHSTALLLALPHPLEVVEVQRVRWLGLP